MRRAFTVLALASLIAASAAAHPHMSLVSKLEFEYDGDLCRGFWVDWTFDPYFSASIIQEHDADGNKRIDAAESKNIYNNAFINLRKYGYFTYIRSGDVRRNPEKVDRFSAEIRGDRLAYRFYVNVAAKGGVNVAVMDTTYFCAVQYPAHPATVAQYRAGSPAPKIERATDKKNPVYYDPSQSATDNSKHTAWRPGLETAYPEEIRAVP